MENVTRIRWLFVQTMRPQPSGQFFRISGDNFHDLMASYQVPIKVDLQAELGSLFARERALSFARLRDFSHKQIVAQIPELQELTTLAHQLEHPSGSSMQGQQIRNKVAQLVGEGRLLAEIDQLLQAKSSSVPEQNQSQASSDLLDDLLSSSRTGDSKSAVDSFVRSLHNETHPSRMEPPLARSISASIQQAVTAAINKVVDHEDMHRQEAFWKGMRWVIEHCPRNSELMLEGIDIHPQDLQRVLMERKQQASALECADAIFVLETPHTIPELLYLAELGADLHIPIVVSITPQLFGCKHLEEFIQRVEQGDSFPDWQLVCGHEASQWLSVVVNAPVLAANEERGGSRPLLASPSLAVAAALAASYGQTKGLIDATGREGALQAPATLAIEDRTREKLEIPTGSLVSAASQTLLAKHGIIALSSGRNSDRIIFSSLPSVATAFQNSPSLTAQIMMGRLVRFSQWMRDQLSSQVSENEIQSLFAQNASIVLPPGWGRNLTVKVLPAEKGENTIHIKAPLHHPYFSGSHIEAEFSLVQKAHN